jgi:hypothetical protein
MRKLLWVLFAWGSLAGCKQETPPESTRKEAGEVVRRTPEALEEDADEGPYVLTQEKLDAYVGYQRRMLEVYAGTAKELLAVRGKAAPGTSGQAPGFAESMKVIEAKAQLEAEARKEAGLSERDVNRIAAVVMDVITQRHMAAMLNLEGELQKLEAMQAKLNPEQQKELAPQLNAMRQRVQEMDRLSSLRSVHGDESVDRVLSREQDLMRNYQDMLRSFGAKAQ